MGLRKDALRSWIIPIVVSLAAIGLQAAGPDMRVALAWDRAALGAGELWRLVSGHLVHLGWSHCALNVAGLLLVWTLVGQNLGARTWGIVAALSIAAMDAGLWLINTELDWYVGLSGLLHGLLAAGLLSGVLRRDRESIVLAVFLVAKLAWEQFSGPLPGSVSSTGGAVIVDAHFYGALGGLLGAWLAGIRFRAAPPI